MPRASCCDRIGGGELPAIKGVEEEGKRFGESVDVDDRLSEERAAREDDVDRSRGTREATSY